jgi:hypothetical protein
MFVHIDHSVVSWDDHRGIDKQRRVV